MNEKLFEEVKKVLAQQYSVDPAKVSETASFEDIGMDSLDLVEFSMLAEDRWHIAIEGSSDDVMERWLTVGDAVREIERLTQ